jgi:hypothetical protein
MPKWGPLHGDPQTRALAQALRDVIDMRGKRLRTLSSAIPYSRTTISERLNGQERPDWPFVEHLVRECFAPDTHGAEIKLAGLRRLWNDADPARRPANPPEPPPESPPADDPQRELLQMLSEVIEDYRRELPPRPGTHRPVWLVPPRLHRFVGRADLLARIEDGFATHRVQALHGLFGVGKTQVAVEYAHRHRADYALVCWIGAQDPMLAESRLAALAPCLGLATDVGTDGILAALGDRAGGRRLLVFDDAEASAAIRRLIPGGFCDVLVTSRDPTWDAVTPGLASVDTFTPRESLRFLAERPRRPLGRRDAGLLADAMDGLPLALEQAVAFLDQSAISPAEYLRLLGRAPGKALGEGNPDGYPLTMTLAWTLVATKLTTVCPDAGHLLRHCAFLGPGPYSRADLHDDAGRADPKVAPVLSDVVRLDRAVEDLARFGLSRVGADHKISIHPLIRALTREEC